MHTNLFNAGRRMQNLNGPEESQKHGVKKMGTPNGTDGNGVLIMKPRNMRNTRRGNAVSVAADLSRRYLENWFLEKSAPTERRRLRRLNGFGEAAEEGLDLTARGQGWLGAEFGRGQRRGGIAESGGGF